MLKNGQTLCNKGLISFKSILLCSSLFVDKRFRLCFFELRRGVCGGAWFICVFGQLVGKANKPILKEKN